MHTFSWGFIYNCMVLCPVPEVNVEIIMTLSCQFQFIVQQHRQVLSCLIRSSRGFIASSFGPGPGHKMTFSWSPLTIHQSPYAVVLLNQPIRLPNFVKLWNAAKVAVSVDGATNYLHELHCSAKEIGIKKPHLISGDFDSINQDVLQYYKGQDVKIVHTPDQDRTDFTKALLELQNGIKTNEFSKVDRILAVAETNGRIDHLFANFKTLFTPELTLPVSILCEQSLSWLLQPGKHTIQVDKPYIAMKYPCGIIPLCGPTHMTSSGLEWNLNDTYRFDQNGMISTSNRITQEIVEITTEKPTIWTMQTPQYSFE